MRIPKRVNAVLDWMEQNTLALGVTVALVAVALAALVAPSSVGLPAAGFILGLAAGGFAVHVRMSRRVARARAEVDALLRENGALRHRNTVLASGVITREAQETQALMSIPEDDLLTPEEESQRTVALDELLDDDPQTTDELPDDVAEVVEPGPGERADASGDEGGAESQDAAGGRDRDDDPLRTTVLTEVPESLVRRAAKKPKAAKKSKRA
ncbi:MAG TPA: hypothetical protein VIL71_19950 [Spirillospora sp.]